MNNTITLIDNTSNLINKVNNKINYLLESKKQQLANSYFKNNSYIQNYIKTFYDNFENSFIDYDYLYRFNSFDFSKIPATLKENLKEYMQNNGLYYYGAYGLEGFTVLSIDNIYINYDGEIFTDFSKNTYTSYNSLEEFLRIEWLQYKNDIYDIIELDYYGQYYNDYEIPEKYKFLKTGMKENEIKLNNWIDLLLNLFDYIKNEDKIYINDNWIIDSFIPDSIKKINLDIEINQIKLDSNFNLSFNLEIPTKLQPQQLEKLNITNYSYDKTQYYNYTNIQFNANIEQLIKDDLKED